MKLGELMYKEAQEKAEKETKASDASGKEKEDTKTKKTKKAKMDEKVVDADFEDVTDKKDSDNKEKSA